MSLSALLSFVRGFLPGHSGISEDGLVAQAHHKLTSLMLLMCEGLVLVATLAHSDKPIACNHDPDENENEKNFAETFCYYNSFIVKELLDQRVGTDVVAPGVGPQADHHTPEYLAYYPWVPSMILGQVVSFNLPRLFWSSTGLTTLKQAIGHLNKTTMEEEQIAFQLSQAKTLLKKGATANFFCALAYLAMEFLNLVVVIFNILLLNVFLNDHFTYYGYEALQKLTNDTVDAYSEFDATFPTVAKCRYYINGMGGSMDKRDTMCVLIRNSFNRNMFMFIWCWYAFLIVVDVGNLIFWALLLSSARVRVWYLKKMGGCSKPSFDRLVDIVMKGRNFSDWFMIYMVNRSMSNAEYKVRLLKKLAYEKDEDEEEVTDSELAPLNEDDDNDDTELVGDEEAVAIEMTLLNEANDTELAGN